MSRNYPIPFLSDLTPEQAGFPMCPSGRPIETPIAYLAGPMRGYEMNNFPAFIEAALILRRHGWEIENPAEYDLAAGVDPSKDESEWPITVRDMLRTDFRIILEQVNSIILLDGWRDSVGAKMELAIAAHIGLPAFELSSESGRLTLERIEDLPIPEVSFKRRVETIQEDDLGVMHLARGVREEEL